MNEGEPPKSIRLKHKLVQEPSCISSHQSHHVPITTPEYLRDQPPSDGTSDHDTPPTPRLDTADEPDDVEAASTTKQTMPWWAAVRVEELL